MRAVHLLILPMFKVVASRIEDTGSPVHKSTFDLEFRQIEAQLRCSIRSSYRGRNKRKKLEWDWIILSRKETDCDGVLLPEVF